MERYRRLLKDFEKDEPQRLETFKKSVIKIFDITLEDLEKKMEEFDGTLKELYIFIKTNYQFKIK